MIKAKSIVITTAALAVLVLTGCAGNEERDAAIEARISQMEEKVNTALRNSASAKVDATTAMHMVAGGKH